MIYIKRKSAVKPINGKIVDSFNVVDKSKNTYSAKVIDELVATGGGSGGGSSGGGSSAGELLWENPDCSVSFPAQTVPADNEKIKKYNAFLIAYKRGSASGNIGMMFTRYCFKNNSTTMEMLLHYNTGYLQHSQRNVGTIKDSSTGFTFGDCYMIDCRDNTRKVDNTLVIPYQIYGYNI